MPQIKVIKPFKFAHQGYQVEEFEVSDDPKETTDECAELAIAEGWAAPAADDPKPAPKRKTKAHDTSPENKG